MFESSKLNSSLPNERTMWLGRELNPRHEDFQSSALPTELPSRETRLRTRAETMPQSGCRASAPLAIARQAVRLPYKN